MKGGKDVSVSSQTACLSHLSRILKSVNALCAKIRKGVAGDSGSSMSSKPMHTEHPKQKTVYKPGVSFEFFSLYLLHAKPFLTCSPCRKVTAASAASDFLPLRREAANSFARSCLDQGRVRNTGLLGNQDADRTTSS